MTDSEAELLPNITLEFRGKKMAEKCIHPERASFIWTHVISPARKLPSGTILVPFGVYQLLLDEIEVTQTKSDDKQQFLSCKHGKQ